MGGYFASECKMVNPQTGVFFRNYPATSWRLQDGFVQNVNAYLPRVSER